MTFRRPDVGHVEPPTFQLHQDGGLERMTHVGASGAIEDRDEARIDRIGLAGIHHALALKRRVNPHRPHEKAVLEVPDDESDDTVTLAVQMSALADGAIYAAQTTLEAKANNITVVIQNFGHRPMSR